MAATVTHTARKRRPAASAPGLPVATHTSVISGRRADCRQSPHPITVRCPRRAFEVKVATERGEFEQAFQLLAARYQARGYEDPSPKLFRFTPFHVLPDTVTFVAKHGDRVVATLSLVPDTSLLGLPMECIYGEEIARLRREGRRLAEATSLADGGLGTREFIQVFTALIKLAMQYHLRQGGDGWVITVNPRHRNYYRKVLGFEPLGPCRSYPMVRDHPAEAFLLDVDLMKANAPRMHGEILGEPLPESVLTAPERSPEHSRYFGERSTQADCRAILEILRFVEHFGSPPRWREEGAAAEGPR
jgi:hypothetical protein